MLGDAFFDLDSAQLRDDAKPALQKNVEWMKRWTTTKVMVEGHCDSRGTAEYNLALGDRRAKAVQDYLVSLGVAANRVADRQQRQGTAVLQRRERSLLAAESPRTLHGDREVVARPQSLVPVLRPGSFVLGDKGLRTVESGQRTWDQGLVTRLVTRDQRGRRERVCGGDNRPADDEIAGAGP